MKEKKEISSPIIFFSSSPNPLPFITIFRYFILFWENILYIYIYAAAAFFFFYMFYIFYALFFFTTSPSPSPNFISAQDNFFKTNLGKIK
ncbi:hypothetical protein BDA99DRAFT_271835 [Phascolomyces articulosus]|uniref:Uncharacterized protein n=1 Tax=Phascolomyces articulosus TaxID=60185 RepID=A0AAD5P7P9_9FUNG|nr:hypothetical protein BDA99DRAFT_271835 [Phascolomyces articulosus]